MKPFVSVIIPVLNNTEGLRRCLDALESQTYPKDLYKVIVVDNSPGGGIEGIVGWYDHAVLCHEPRRGSYAARNRGLSVARGDVIAFTDSDCIPAPEWIEKGVEALLGAPGCGLVAGRVEVFFMDPGSPTAVELYEGIRGFPQEAYVKNSRFGATANLFVSREVFKKAGVFDEDLSSGGDYEWGRRVHSAGYGQVYAGEAWVAHPARRGLGELYLKVCRVALGLHELRRAGKIRIRPLQLCLMQPLDGMYRICRDRKAAGIRRKCKAFSIELFVVLVRAWELTRLRLGGRPRWPG
jgi:glycosyltransferase involved in cell wall biosynthesis